MKKIFERRRSSASRQADTDVTSLMHQIQQQLNSLEKKVDILINQPSGEPQERPFREKHFSKPHHFFGGASHHDRGRRENRDRERKFTQVVCADCGQECEVPFKPSEDRPVYCRECFAKRKDDNSFRGKHEDKFRDEGHKPFHEFDHKKKHFSRRRK